MPRFADVILPLAIPRPLTYSIGDEDVRRAQVGCRVVVTLGKSKLITGVISAIHDSNPEGYVAKPVDSVLDDEPIVVSEQISMWSWMAAYYCCTIGEVMSAALPAALKLSSETSFSLIPDFADELYEWNDRQWAVIEAIRVKGSISLKDAADLPGIRSAQAVIKSLIEKGVLVSTEELKEKFRPKMTTFLSLEENFRSEETLNHIFGEMEKRNAKRQSDALLAFLRLAAWDGETIDEVAKPRLTKEPGVSNAAIQSLIDKGVLRATERETGRLPKEALSHGLKDLSTVQHKAYDEIFTHWKSKDVVMLHGVTSSGKTEVYAHIVRDVVAAGKQVLFLLPEIALTVQIIERFRHYFGLATGIYHSGYSGDERTEVWKKVLENNPGDHDIILGARSSLFLPFRNLGLIIVDEEHEQSYKQVDPAPRYNARDMAVVLASMHGAKVILGSATPSVETYWNARADRFGLVEMQERHGGMELPAVELVDIRDELRQKTMQGHFTTKLVDEIRHTLDSGRQVILFQNRRGYTPLWQCQSCGWVPECARCDVSMTYHKQQHKLKCHYCGYAEEPPTECQACMSTDIRMIGFGTEKLEEDVAQLFPDAKTDRLDMDTARSRQSLRRIMSDFESGEIGILVGTKMITKGLDFDHVGLVGVLSADKMMNYPDFRSMENAYQLMSQVAGRAGRKGKQGKVIIQTFNPSVWLLGHVVKHDYQGFYAHEIAERKRFGYPPFVRLVKIILKHRDDVVLEMAAQALGDALHKLDGIFILGPEVPYVARINNLYIRNFLIKLERNSSTMQRKELLKQTVAGFFSQPGFQSVRYILDVDPQ